MIGEGDLAFLRALVAREGAGVVVDAILPKPDSAYIVAYGNPVDGYGFTGPIGGRDAAVRWAAENEKYLDGDWTIAPLLLPEGTEADPPAPDLAALREEADKLRRACELLKAAYDRGAESRSIDWSDVDVAYLTALSALGEG